ncbi:hypothetical protein BV25DRAFT_1910723 [Artomyces pyxidatus]|uniref:Uncharacterized protein n=1 Tax=Artomyces pyxidatus TaxID=48021 RepID=A0ACB8TKN6_9AGAM|nr:hypothetical protein BV25DRAFT_1910723 [Artomyces pyxidatus]
MEDLQPNEARPTARKSNPRVPKVVHVSTVNRRGRGYHRGSFRGGFQPSRLYPASEVTRQHPFRVAAHNAYADTSVERPSKRPLVSTGSNGEKRRRIDTPSTLRHAPNVVGAFPGASPGASPVMGASSKKKRVEFEMRVVLPPECRRGAPDSQSKRRNFIRHQMQQIYQQQHVPVHRHDVVDEMVRFYVDRNEMSIQGGAHTSEEGTISWQFVYSFKLPENLVSPSLAHPPLPTRVETAPLISSKNPVDKDLPEVSRLIRYSGKNHTSNSAATGFIVSAKNLALTQKGQVGQQTEASQKTPSLRSPQARATYEEPIDLTEESPIIESIPIEDVPISPSSGEYPFGAPGFYQFKFSSGSVTVKRPIDTVPPRHEQPHEGACAVSSSADALSGSTRLSRVTGLPVAQTSAPVQPSKEPFTVSRPPSHPLAPVASSSRIAGGNNEVALRNSDQVRAAAGDHTSPVDVLGDAADKHALDFRVAGIIRLPKDQHDKPRRILLLPDNDSVFCASLHGFIYRVDRTPPRKRTAVRSPDLISPELIDDACIISSPSGPRVVLGHVQHDEKQISLFPLYGDSVLSLTRGRQGDKNGGISAVTAMTEPGTFASGGFDHAVHLWSLDESASKAHARPLAIRHTSLVQSLIPIRDTSRKLMTAGADCNVHLWDLSSERVVNTMKTSNSAFHVHATPLPYCVLLEVAHRELQFELRDYRLVPERPVQRFGYYTPKIHGRFMKGSLAAHQYACGDRDGRVRLWDLRNPTKELTSGAAQYGAAGAGLATLAHYTSPVFRRQTLAFKGFLVSIATIYGLVSAADTALLSHEHDQRMAETDLRREARLDLARRGMVPTETQIAKWKDEREHALRTAEQNNG